MKPDTVLAAWLISAFILPIGASGSLFAAGYE